MRRKAVKAVLIGLAFASIVTWTVWLAKTTEILFQEEGGLNRAQIATGGGGRSTIETIHEVRLK